MDDTWRSIGLLALILALLILSFLITLFRTALLHISESKIRAFKEENSHIKKQEYAINCLKNQGKTSTLCQSSVMVIFAANIYISVYLCIRVLADYLKVFEVFSENQIYGALTVIITVVLVVYLLLVFGYSFPKKIAQKNPERMFLKLCTILRPFLFLSKVLLFVPLTLSVTLSKAFGVKNPDENQDITEEEIRILVDVGNEIGSIEESEKEMINNIFEFNDITVDEVMTHRTDISAVQKDALVTDAIKISIEEGFSRIPVYEDDIDDIIGIIYIKDLLELIGDTKADNKKVVDYMRDVIYVPESTRLRMLFKQFKDTKVHMAVIVDEYGGTAGIATMEDLLESIVGNIQDEYDSEEDEILLLEDGSYSLDGSLDVEDAEDLFRTKLVDDDDTDTIGGLVSNTLGRIPDDDEKPSVVINGIMFTVEKAEDRRIVRINAKKLVAQENDMDFSDEEKDED